MNNPIFAKLERTNSDLINMCVLAIGAGTIFASLLCGQWPDVKNTLLSVGCSLVATAIVSYLTSRYMVRSARVRELVDHWGLEAVYETRQKMNASADGALSVAIQHCDAMGWGFRSFRDAKGAMLADKVKMGLKVR